MLKDIISSEFYSVLKEGSKKILENERIRVLVHNDGDGASSGIILCNVLKRSGIEFDLSFIKSLDPDGFRRKVQESSDIFTVIADAGSDQAQFIPEFDNIVILDHHFYKKSEFKGLNINARDYGVDGTREACGATMSFLMALAISEKNSDLLPFMIAGLIADKQDIGGFRGLNATIVEHYGKSLEEKHPLNLEGENIGDALTFSIDPFIYNLSGKPENVKTALEGIGLDPSIALNSITDSDSKKLFEFLALRLLQQGVSSESIKYLESDIFFFRDLGFSSKELSTIIDGNSKLGENGVPVGYFLGEKGLQDAMINNWKIYKSKLIEYTYRVFKEIFEEKNVRYFYAPEQEMTGAISGILTLYVLKQDKPLVGINVGDSDTKISSRAARPLLSRGLNLSTVMKESASQVGGSGGGHDIAAGAIIPRGKEKQFIEIANNIIGGQLGHRETT
ncbi:MAG: DHH family phosphoesterase [Thermoplasmatales archaeon]|nr:DHH family phosphoesterase [Thermoplasmatales archaeon]MCW6170274.1 DHH family phosphoesterase [Thermoplasmatales archaeon]